MCLVLHDLLDILGTPVMKPLTLGATFAPGEIEVFHDDDVDLELVCNRHDEACRLDGDVLVAPPFALAQSLGMRFAPLL